MKALTRSKAEILGRLELTNLKLDFLKTSKRFIYLPSQLWIRYGHAL